MPPRAVPSPAAPAARRLSALGLALATAQAASGAPLGPATEDLAAQPLERLLDVEVSAVSKFPQRLSESPAAATVVTAAQIRALGHRTLAEVLRSVRGVFVSSDRAYAYLGVRGSAALGDYNTRILLLIDGTRVNDTVYDQAMLGSEFPVDLDLVERVEFVPGQGSAVHGANALFGIVNVITRHAAVAGGSEAAASVGSAGARGVRLTRTWVGVDGGSLLLSASGRRSDGEDPYYTAFDDPPRSDGVSRGTDDERGEQLFAKFARGGLAATLLHADRRHGLSGEDGVVFGDPRNEYRDIQTLASVSWEQPVAEATRWTLRAYGGEYDFRGDYVIDGPAPALNHDRALSRWWGLESLLYTERFAGHRLVGGVDAEASPRRDLANRDAGADGTSYLDDHGRGERLSLFAEDQWTITPALALTAGLRHDRIDGEGHFSQRFALVGRPSEALTLKLIHGTAFREPNAYESRYDLGALGGYKGNPDLDAERVRGTELVAEFRPSPQSRWTAAAFDNRARDLISQRVDPADGLLVYRNGGTQRTHGFELEFEHAWLGGAELRLNLSEQHGDEPADASAQPAAPHRMAKAVAIWPLAAAWTLGAETLLFGPHAELAGYGLSNLTLSTQALGRAALLSVSVYDLFDRRPDDLGTGSLLQSVSPQDGRSLRLKLELAF